MIGRHTMSTTLQHIDLAAEPATQGLHFTYDWKAHRRHPVLLAPSNFLRIPGGLRVSFDAYFNSFFESYWSRYTSVNGVSLSVNIAGYGVLSVYRQAADGSEYLVQRLEYSTDGTETITIRLDRESGFTYSPGRMWFEIEAYHDSVIEGGGWETDTTGRSVAAGIVLCTFNREKFVARTLAALKDAPEVYTRIAKIFIVNQGKPFEIEELLPRSPRRFLDKITLIEQENLGGCGGFTRGMFETLKDPHLTHFVLLDDDIKLHPESLFRAMRFLQFARDGVAVGGHMLDLARPNHLYEAGARLDPAIAEPIPLFHGHDLTEDEGLEIFLEARPVDYNGWWLFGASKSAIEDAGLPMPSFIRGDDIEYGVRLGRTGHPTVAVPGIGVWHEPFYFKLGNWHLYFEIRNRLTMLSLHGNGDLKAVKRQLRKVFTRDAMLSRYHSCQFIIAALEDYLAGPSRCFDTSNDALMARLEEVDELGPRKVVDSGEATVKTLSRRFRLLSKPGFVVLRSARLVSGAPRGSRVPTLTHYQLTPWRLAVFNKYRVIEPGGTVVEYTRDPHLERVQLARFERLLARLQYQFDEEVVDHSRAIPWLGRWEEIFKERVTNNEPIAAALDTRTSPPDAGSPR
jgi:galactofuranosylgalactofuranosylrhamnosyl-N-acetylglucosaminyl-diphospho-decaprenol beta-1,5/1,6-galactofuranosyltransferase